MSNFVDPFKVNKGEYLPKKKKDNQKDKVIPRPYTLSQWGDGSEVFYECPKCGQDFRLLGSRQNYCFNCGIKLDWEFTIKNVTPEIKSLYQSFERDYHRLKIDYKTMYQLKKKIRICYIVFYLEFLMEECLVILKCLKVIQMFGIKDFKKV